MDLRTMISIPATSPVMEMTRMMVKVEGEKEGQSQSVQGHGRQETRAKSG